MTADFTNVNAAGLTDQGTYTPDALFDRDTLQRKGTIKSGSGVLLRGSLLGKVSKGGATSAAKAGGNTGNGTLVLDATTPVLAKAVVGVHTVRFVTTTSVLVLDPNGVSLGTYAIGGSAGNNVTIADRLKFLLTQGATPFAAGDGFDITLAAGSGQYVLATAAAVDGSDVPDTILLESVDATSAAVEASMAIKGRFATQGIIFGAGVTAANADDVLRTKDIYLQNIVG